MSLFFGKRSLRSMLKIFVLTPLTGTQASYGLAAKAVLEQAFENAEPIGGAIPIVSFEDTASDLERTLFLLNKGLDWGMNVLVLAVPSVQTVRYVRDYMSANMPNVPVFCCGCSCENTGNLFDLSISDGLMIDKILQEGAIGHNKLALIDDGSPEIDDIYQKLNEYGFTSEKYYVGSGDLDAAVQLQRMKESGMELIIYPLCSYDASKKSYTDFIVRKENMGFAARTDFWIIRDSQYFAANEADSEFISRTEARYANCLNGSNSSLFDDDAYLYQSGTTVSFKAAPGNSCSGFSAMATVLSEAYAYGFVQEEACNALRNTVYSNGRFDEQQNFIPAVETVFSMPAGKKLIDSAN